MSQLSTIIKTQLLSKKLDMELQSLNKNSDNIFKEDLKQHTNMKEFQLIEQKLKKLQQKLIKIKENDHFNCTDLFNSKRKKQNKKTNNRTYKNNILDQIHRNEQLKNSQTKYSQLNKFTNTSKQTSAKNTSRVTNNNKLSQNTSPKKLQKDYHSQSSQRQINKYFQNDEIIEKARSSNKISPNKKKQQNKQQNMKKLYQNKSVGSMNRINSSQTKRLLNKINSLRKIQKNIQNSVNKSHISYSKSKKNYNSYKRYQDPISSSNKKKTVISSNNQFQTSNKKSNSRNNSNMNTPQKSKTRVIVIQNNDKKLTRNVSSNSQATILVSKILNDKLIKDNQLKYKRQANINQHFQIENHLKSKFNTEGKKDSLFNKTQNLNKLKKISSSSMSAKQVFFGTMSSNRKDNRNKQNGQVGLSKPQTIPYAQKRFLQKQLKQFSKQNTRLKDQISKLYRFQQQYWKMKQIFQKYEKQRRSNISQKKFLK